MKCILLVGPASLYYMYHPSYFLREFIVRVCGCQEKRLSTIHINSRAFHRTVQMRGKSEGGRRYNTYVCMYIFEGGI